MVDGLYIWHKSMVPKHWHRCLKNIIDVTFGLSKRILIDFKYCSKKTESHFNNYWAMSQISARFCFFKLNNMKKSNIYLFMYKPFQVLWLLIESWNGFTALRRYAHFNIFSYFSSLNLFLNVLFVPDYHTHSFKKMLH